jgi:hypothetical protein
VTRGSKGENLIFVISQPRAGSTLLQKMLAAHPEIHTVSEPWIALHPLFALREQGIIADFDQHLAHLAIQEFLRQLPEREEAYWESVRRMLSYLYNRALDGSGKSTFLDKTPRYYFVIPELRRVFPDARFVFLLRNPIAVLSSILETWVKRNNALILSKFRHDLMAPRLILEGIRASGSNAIVARYEELASTPETAIQRLCSDLGINYSPFMIDYGAATANRERWTFGDQGTLYEEIRPVAGRAERWKSVLKQSSTWTGWALDYLSALGPGVVGEMGYDFKELSCVLTASRKTFPESLMDGPATDMRWEEPGTVDELAEVRRLLVERTAELERTVKDLQALTAELAETRGLSTKEREG